MKAMKSLRFDNAALRSLPVDPSTKNVPRQVSACYSRVEPTPVENPKIIAASDSALRLIGLDKETVLADQDYAEYFSGNKLFQGSEPAAHCYSGHQFGSFAGQLGDGRAISLGEVVNDSRQRWELQLKGAGKTPFSRFADGRAVLRSSIREYLCSEHMAALGVPTTRAGTLVLSTTLATRDPQYNGRQILEKCAIVSRIAPTFLRFGSWEVFKPRDFDEAPTNQNKAVGNQMLNHAVEHFFPEIHEEFKQPAATGELQTQKALKFYEEIVRRTARMVAEWQLVGFTHGVLNTDNMSILGVTIDYGPFGFLDKYNPHFTPNTTDESGRYRFEAQPQICKWNLIKFAEALEFGECLPYKLAEKSLLSLFDSTFHEAYWGKLRNKLGLHAEDPDDQNLCEAFFATLRKTNGDFTNSFRILSRVAGSGDFPEEVLDYLVKQSGTVEDAVRSVPVIYTSEQIQSLKLLKERSPQTFEIITGGNEHVIAEAEEMLKAVAELRKMDPAQKKEQDRTLWRAWLVRYKERVGKETLPEEKRREMMNSANPKYILRNYLLQNAIAEAEKGDYSGVHRLEKVMLRPFEEWEGEEDLGVNGEVPVWACNYVLSCSS